MIQKDWLLKHKSLSIFRKKTFFVFYIKQTFKMFQSGLTHLLIGQFGQSCQPITVRHSMYMQMCWSTLLFSKCWANIQYILKAFHAKTIRNIASIERMRLAYLYSVHFRSAILGNKVATY